MVKGYYKYSDNDSDFEPEVKVCSEGCESVQGNSVDIKLKEDDCEVRADVTVSRRKSVRVWGQVVDCNKKPIKCALVKLLKIIPKCDGHFDFEGVAHTVTDCMGFYQFEICDCDCDENRNIKYKVIVGKSVAGKNREIGHGEGKCNPCNSHNDCCECE